MNPHGSFCPMRRDVPSSDTVMFAFIVDTFA